MIEVSGIIFTLLVELLVILSVAWVFALFFSLKKKKNDRQAAHKLADQIKQQSDLRLKETGSFLQEKYSFEGNQLQKAIKLIDKTEKSFFQKIINLYLHRDAAALSSLDAAVAELIDVYKSLTPAKTETVQSDTGELEDEIEHLKLTNANLAEELAITKQTMSNMIGEFGNMFGGGSDNNLDQEEVVEKVIHKDERNQKADLEDIAIDVSEPDEVTSVEDIDDILNGISSEDK